MGRCMPILGLLLLSLISLGSAEYGTATFYTPPYLPSACNGFEGMGTMIAAASDVFWDGGGACGKHFRVMCKHDNNGPSPCRDTNGVTIKITDQCPPGSCHGTIDLSKEAFAMIAHLDAGVIHIEYIEVHGLE